MSTTRAEERNSTDAQLGSVVTHTSTSSGSMSLKVGSWTTRTKPSTIPPLAPMPLTAACAACAACAAEAPDVSSAGASSKGAGLPCQCVGMS